MIELINKNYNELIILMISIILLGIIIMLIPLFIKKEKKEIIDTTKIDKSIDQEKIKKEAFSLYKKIEVAKSKFDFDTLKEILSESLYIKEEETLKQLKADKQKLVATNIKLQEAKIISVQNKNNVEKINLYLHVSQYAYVINNKKKVVRGTDDTVYQIEYKITLEKTKNEQYKITKKECTGKWINNH